MNLHKLIFTENACYKAGRKITVKGIMVHSTGANNPWLKRYVGPDDGLLGKNQYLKKYEALTERYEKAAAELERLQSLRTARSQQDKKMALYIRTLKKQPEVMHDWNDTIWTVMIEKAIVHKDGQITFVFQSGTEIKVGA